MQFSGAATAESVTRHLQDAGHDWAVFGLGAAVLVSVIAFFLALVLWLKTRTQLAGLRAGTVDFRELAEFAGDWVWEMDENLRFTYLSPRFFELFAIPVETILGKTRKEYLGKEAHGEKWQKHFRDMDARRPFRDFKYPLTDTAGSPRLIRISGKPVFDEVGAFKGYHGTGTDLTREGMATAQAAKAEALLADAIESITAGFALFDAEDRLVVCNSKYRAGHPKINELAKPGILFEEIIRNLAGLGLYHPDMGDLDDFLEKRFAYHRDRPSDHEQHMSDGRWMHVYEFATHEGGAVLLLTDITERKMAEQALEESEIRFRNLTEGSVQGVLIHGNHKPLFVNQAYAEIFGYDSPEDLIDHGSALDHVAPHERARMKGYSDARIAGRDAPVHYEFEGLRKDGTSIWLENRAQAVTWEGGKAVQRTVVDVTERKRAEEKLRQSEENYRHLVEGSVQGIFIHRDYKPLFVNQELVKIFGYDSAEEMMALPSVDLLYAPGERARLKRYMETRLGERQEEVPTYYEFQGLKKDGSVIWLYRTSRNVVWEGEAAIQGAMIDVTDGKNAEETLRSAKEEAEMGNRAKSEFLANMSHELRTPLNSVIGFSQVIKDGLLGTVDSGRYEEYAADIFESGKHLLGLINDILDVSKIEVGEMDLAEDIIDIPEVVDACTRMVKERANKAQVSLSIEPLSGYPRLRADERRLKQILLNLLSNAVKFTPPEGRIRIGAREDELGGLSLWVADTGIGIAPEDIPVVLKPFSQVASSHTRSHDGSGLGLALVKSLSEIQGARLDIDSAPGKGTTVSIRFPPERVIRDSKGAETGL